MALQLTTELQTGVTGNYWRIAKTEVEYSATPLLVAYANLYKDAETRADATKSALEQRRFVWSASDLDFADATVAQSSLRAIAYTAMKALPEFAEASDV